MSSRPPRLRATSAAGWRRAIGRSLLFTACLLGALAAPAALLITDPGEPLRDLHAYYDAGARLNAGEPLYDPAGDPDGTTFYRYPPLVAILFRPLALLPYELVRLLWAGLVAATFALTLRRVGAGAPGMRLVAALALLAMPITLSLYVGQAQVPLTFLMALGSPWAIALAANLKLFPGLVALFWLGRRDRARLGRFLLWMAGLGLVQLILEPAGTLAYPGFLSLSQVGEAFDFSPYAISPALWIVFLVVGTGATVALARGRWGWAAAVTFATCATPRLLVYLFMALLAALRGPDERRAPAAPSEPGDPGGGTARLRPTG